MLVIYRLIVITFIAGLLVTGCGGGNSDAYDSKLTQNKSCYDAVLESQAGYIQAGRIYRQQALDKAESDCAQYKP
jgi:hypothetical protein